jgi:hypothetical protein
LGAFIHWELVQASNKTRPNSYSLPGEKDSGRISLQSLNVSTASNPYLAFDRTTAIGDTEDIWEFTWTILYSNCSRFWTEKNTTIEVSENGISSYIIDFTTSRAAPQPASVETALANDTCRIGDYFTVNVTEYNIFKGDYCSELGETPTGENRNCRIGDDAKKNVTDHFAYMACMDSSVNKSKCLKPWESVAKAPVKPSLAVRGVEVSMSWMLVAMISLGVLFLQG